MSTSTVLVLGARGRLGAAARLAFAHAGWEVVAQARPEAGLLPAQPGVRWVRAAPGDTESLVAAAGPAAVVVHALSPAYTHKAWRREVPALTEAGIAIARRLGATLMLPGNVYNFGTGMPPRLAEGTPQRADTFKGHMRVALEQQLAAATQDGSMRAVVLRAGDFFGSGTGGWLDQAIAKDLPRGRVSWPGPRLDVPSAWANLPDLARAFVQVAEHRSALAAFESLHFAGYSVTGQEWLEALAIVAREQGWLAPGQALQVKHLPWPLLRLAGLFVPTLQALAEMRYLYTTPHALDDTRLRSVIGQPAHTPFVGAVRQAVLSLNLTGPATPARALVA